ncbi:MAG: carboxypeptidase-like regulatory domain-containing protein [Gemmatimonadota bacterium]|nr:hypothetical protein [Gemmatimonadota bacterium]MDP6461370.1 carboxypeptidase-like regulatory domain-containing protein [Gemmatimonadota bacterium]MDP6528375.1 carboxypeptidase-like regulatory domain-containing protein [Gemmatimonadota bacterium]MDP6802831.1 carboxypeptidase-like regulatory domain-containing protein [Gemmatimonadota bacterium]MDP7031044.1 carboxypeptidase-like regulatory domain-containing protein [Gemmatimonadota bacterium]
MPTIVTRSFLCAAACSAALLSAMPGCSSPSRDFRGTVLDSGGAPVPGAVVYAEAVGPDGPIGFLTARTGAAGEVPVSAREPLPLPWGAGATAVLAAFAPGKLPTILHAPPTTDGVVLILRDLPEGSRWEPRVASLAFPFPDDAALADRAASPECVELRAALRAAWSEYSPESGRPPSAREESAHAAFRALESRISAASGPSLR